MSVCTVVCTRVTALLVDGSLGFNLFAWLFVSSQAE